MPLIYHLEDDGSADCEFSCIPMEDLTNHPQVFDQVTDTPDEAYTRKISLEVAGMAVPTAGGSQ